MTCSFELRLAGKMYPRTCQDCGLGPCRKALSVKTPAEPSPSQAFAAWVEAGPKLAKAAGLYVGITVTANPPSTPPEGREQNT